MDLTDTSPRSQAHVLVVDDEPVVRRFATRVLADAGYSVATAVDGAEALVLVRERGEPVRVVVSDIIMPRLNGVQLLEALSVSHPRLPIILMSGYAPAELAQRGIAAPCSVLAKPFAPEVLLAEVRRCLESASPEGPTPNAA